MFFPAVAWEAAARTGPSWTVPGPCLTVSLSTPVRRRRRSCLRPRLRIIAARRWPRRRASFRNRRHRRLLIRRRGAGRDCCGAWNVDGAERKRVVSLPPRTRYSDGTTQARGATAKGDHNLRWRLRLLSFRLPSKNVVSRLFLGIRAASLLYWFSWFPNSVCELRLQNAVSCEQPEFGKRSFPE